MRLLKTILFTSIIAAFCASCSDTKIISTEGFLEINGSEIYYKTMGEGDPLIIIHGGPVLDHSYLLPHLAALAEDYQLIFYDQRATGRSSIEVAPATMSLDGFVEDIEVLRQQLDLGKINLLGHSWGGLIAMKYALKHDDNLNHLILSNAMAPSTIDWQEESKAVAQKITKEDQNKRNNLTSSGLLRTEDPSAAIEEMMMLSYRAHMFDKANMDKLKLFIPKDFMLRSQLYSSLNPDLESYDLYAELINVKTPTLIIFGEIEPAVSLHAKRMAASFPDAELYVVSASGHFPFIEANKDYIQHIKSFIGQ